jgi:16S rRNA (cytidine1402-2'-O)-methyltransferase
MQATLQDCCSAFGSDRLATLARELTKTFETIHHAPLGELYAQFSQLPPVEQRGEFVLLIGGSTASDARQAEGERVLGLLLAELPLKQAVSLTARITDLPHRWLYQRALQLRAQTGSPET